MTMNVFGIVKTYPKNSSVRFDHAYYGNHVPVDHVRICFAIGVSQNGFRKIPNAHMDVNNIRINAVRHRFDVYCQIFGFSVKVLNMVVLLYSRMIH